MIIVDLQQVMISNLMMQMSNQKSAELDENLLRHMILNSIRSYTSRYCDKYGELVIACDSRGSWRREFFPYYKANRRQAREETTTMDWTAIFTYLAKIRAELRENFPYRVIEVEGAEADDIIATLVHTYGPEGARILILSGDKDFIQLHTYMAVEQYDPVRKKKITHNNPDTFKAEHIIKGDKGDGVPSILMADNSLVLRERAKPVTQKKLDAWLKQKPEEFCNEQMLQRWHRNKQLIDLDCVPKNIQEKILIEYEGEAGKGRKKMFNYFMTHKLKHLMEVIGDF